MRNTPESMSCDANVEESLGEQDHKSKKLEMQVRRVQKGNKGRKNIQVGGCVGYL